MKRGTEVIIKPDTVYTYKRLNQDATIMGYPFAIFFIAMAWVGINLFIITSVPFFIKILVGIIAGAGILFLNIVFKKYGLIATQKYIDLFFKKVEVIKLNEQIIIKKLNLKENE